MTLIADQAINLPAYTTTGFQGHMLIARTRNTTFPTPTLDGSLLLDGSWHLRGLEGLEVDGAFVGTTHGTTLQVNGLPLSLMHHKKVAAGAQVSLKVHPKDLPFEGHLYLTLLTVQPDGDWQKEHVWEVTTSNFVTFRASYTRVPGMVVVYVYNCPENAVKASVRDENQFISRNWSGMRDAIDQSKAFVFTLNEDTSEVSIVVTDQDGNQGFKTLQIPPLTVPPKYTPNWEVPFWIPEVEGNQRLLDSFGQVLSDPKQMLKHLSPVEAEEEYLDLHGKMQGLNRAAGEHDDTYRTRILAVPRGNFVSPRGLEQHLMDLTKVPVKVRDIQTAYGNSVVLLDGSHKLDGTWTLGGDEGTLIPAGQFLVIFEGVPRLPLNWIVNELNRLRLAGTFPIMVIEHTQEIRPFKALLGTHIQNLQVTHDVLPTGTWVQSEHTTS